MMIAFSDGKMRFLIFVVLTFDLSIQKRLSGATKSRRQGAAGNSSASR
jgi:hypothetical protein